MHIKPQPQQLLILLSKNSVRICETLNKEKFLCCFVKENLVGNFFSLKFCKHFESNSLSGGQLLSLFCSTIFLYFNIFRKMIFCFRLFAKGAFHSTHVI